MLYSLLPYPIRFWMPQALIEPEKGGKGITTSKRRTGIAAARREAKKRRKSRHKRK